MFRNETQSCEACSINKALQLTAAGSVSLCGGPGFAKV